MEGEREERGESSESLSGTTSASVDTTAQNCSEDSKESPNLQQLQEEEEEKEEQGDEETEPIQAEEDIVDAERLPQATDEQGDADRLPPSPPPTEEEMTPLPVSSHPSTAQNEPSDPCWYCLRSLDSEYRPEVTTQQGGQDSSSPLPSSGQKVSYQTDPRPHFGVAWSSHSTCRPLWDSEGPSWEPRNQEVPDQTHTCPHCYLGLPPETLRWHEAKCLLFEGLRNTKK